KCEYLPTIRASIMIARTCKSLNISPSRGGALFGEICQDILASQSSRVGSKTNQNKVREIVRNLVQAQISPPIATLDPPLVGKSLKGAHA
ncbi:MAG: hypothetical protein WCO14_02900, partial [bacterium]